MSLILEIFNKFCIAKNISRSPLMMICLRENAQKKVDGLSPVAADVINTIVSNLEFWVLLKQFHQTVALVVDTIGNLES